MLARTSLVASFVLSLGCGGSTSTLGSPDATSGDGTSGADGTSGGDGSQSDAMPSDAGDDGVIEPDGACGCEPYWCGCGPCNPGDIACTVSPPPCTRGCASSCPEIQQTTCTCEDGRCARHGIDSGTIGCLVDHDCPAGDCCGHVQGKGICMPNGSSCCAAPCP